MIWNPHNEPSQGRSAVVSSITSEIDGVCGDLLGHAGSVEEIARAVEIYLEEFGDGAIDRSHLVMMASHALSTLGEGKAAHRLLLFGTGFVCPSEWEVTGGEAVWVVDLKQITVRQDAALELIFFNCLNMVLDAVAEVWDGTRGSGVLGLRHVSVAASSLLNTDKKRDLDIFAREVKVVCLKRLEQLRAERNWSSTPEVMDLDI
jgi:hypothetical protein